ncbi:MULTISPECIES: LysR family transcriptional regulator [unclassified Lactobacillus]|uniref:LysR family transcriptional regulator n=1 Tax=unclassified Lactobacillus TaxID=2620435 RepID=UPI000EFC19B9|nr:MULTISPECIES: LysR family transcriptional regulator [unclassified Lactobacillus]RMC26324.1 LysR family transcriptional regulator [Lactobacillus sp. ESL0247]RMC29862.1 LysR family transcriptional regulator [Lactobacillus sp. ESL0246]RMC34519.1 LysR family transcriptional regulator [Lactobacillus sp. ESL0245]
MELRVLNYFVAVAQESNMTHAAKKLLISQPALSRQIAELEQELGVKLFNRNNRRLTLTPAGQYLLGQAKEILALTAKTKSNLTASAFIGGELTIAAGESWGMQRIMNIIGGIITDYPSVKINLLSGDYSYAECKLNNGTADFAIIIGDIPLTNYASLTLPEKDTWGILMANNDPLTQKAEIMPQDLIGRSILNSQQSQSLQIFQNWLGNYNNCVNFIGTYNLIFNGTLLVKNHAAIMFALDNLVSTDPSSGLTFRKLSPQLHQRIKIVWKREINLSPVAELFLKRLKKSIFNV